MSDRPASYLAWRADAIPTALAGAPCSADVPGSDLMTLARATTRATARRRRGGAA